MGYSQTPGAVMKARIVIQSIAYLQHPLLCIVPFCYCQFENIGQPEKTLSNEYLKGELQ